MKLLLAVLLASLAAQAESPVPRASLKLRQEVPVILQAGPSFAQHRCDSQGNIYVRMLTDSKNPGRSVLSKIGGDGKVRATFDPVIKEIGSEGTAGDFAVLSDGSVSTLMGANDAFYLVRYAPNGKLGSTTRLSFGRDLGPHQLIPIGGRQMLLLGEKITRESDKKQTSEPITALINANGDLERYLDTKEAFKVDAKGNVTEEEMSELANSQTVTDEAGTVYIMRRTAPTRIIAFTGAGEYLRTYNVEVPEPGYVPLNILANGGKLAITYIEITEDDGVTKQAQAARLTRIVDQQSGLVMIDYIAPPEAKSTMDCYIAPDQFLQLGQRDGRLTLLKMGDAVSSR